MRRNEPAPSTDGWEVRPWRRRAGLVAPKGGLHHDARAGPRLHRQGVVTAEAGRGSQTALPLELRLAREQTAPAQARSAVSEWCEPLALPTACMQALVLLVSEVVSNAVLHSTAPADSAIVLTAQLDGENVRVSVSDAGEGFEPRPRDPARLSDGYGLFLLDKIASRWGVDDSRSTSVWFELPRSEAP